MTLKVKRETIRERAERLWREDGAPRGRKAEYLERARELRAIENNPAAGLLPNPASAHPERTPGAPPVEEADLMENLGEFPTLFEDQGEHRPFPMTRSKARRALREE